MKHRHHHERRERVALRFTAEDKGKIYIFKNPFDNENYSFELLESLSVPVAELDAEFPEHLHFKKEVAVEQLWCRILPKCDSDCFAIGYDEVRGELIDGDASDLMLMGVGIRLDAPRDFGENVYICSALKPNRDFEIQWRVELFEPERRGEHDD